MSDPVLHLVAGPNGAGRSTFFEHIVGPATRLEFVNADVIAAERWPDEAAARSYDAARDATQRRERLIDERRSFATETEFSHISKLDLVRAAVDAGYLVTLHVVMVPEPLAVARVRSRVSVGGHAVPAAKVRGRYRRLWPLVADAARLATTTTTTFSDNSRATRPFRIVATLELGVAVRTPDWPAWAPAALRGLTA